MESIYGSGVLRTLIASLLKSKSMTPFDAAIITSRAFKLVIEETSMLLTHADYKFREAACYIASETEAPEASDIEKYTTYITCITILENHVISDRHYRVRSAATIALGKIGNVSSVDTLVKASKDGSKNVRLSVAAALGSFTEWEGDAIDNKKSVADALLQLMDDPDREVRSWATFGLCQGNHDTPLTRSRLWLSLDDPYVDVRGEAAVALASFGDHSIIARLDTLLRTDDQLTQLYFEAAEELGDSMLLDAVLIGSERWSKTMIGYETVARTIQSAVASLSKQNIS